jgi:hypothetical protein
MATVNFSVPEEVKRAFNETFGGRNKSAVIARLMMEAVEEERRKERRREAIASLAARRSERPFVTTAELASARAEARTWP